MKHSTNTHHRSAWMAPSLTAVVLLSVHACEQSATEQTETTASATGQYPTIPAAPRTVETVSAFDGDMVDTLRRLARTDPGPASVAERDASNRPILHYAMIELTEVAHAEALQALGIVYDVLPLFEADWTTLRTQLSAATTYVTSSRDAQSTFVYAMVPASVYNRLKIKESAGSPIVASVRLTDIPDLGGRSGGATQISYDWLAANDFQWAPPTDRGSARNASAGPLAARATAARAAAAAIAGEVAADLDLVRATLAGQAALFGNKVDIDVRVRLFNIEQFFQGSSGQLLPMFQGWGLSRGAVIDMSGLEVVARQGPARRRGTIGFDQRTTIRVKKNKGTLWCVNLVTKGAIVTDDFYLPVQLCNLSSPQGVVIYTAATTEELLLQNPRVNVLAQATDTHNWLRRMVGIVARPARMLVGPNANAFAALNGNDIPFAPCGSYYGELSFITGPLLIGRIAEAYTNSIAIGVIAGLLGGRSLTKFLNRTLGYVDVVMPDVGAPDRGLVAHEAGHYAFCAIMAEVAPTKFEFAWHDVIIETLIPQIEGPGRGVEHQASWVAEGFADFFSAQLVGGTDYFAAPNAVGSTSLDYCPGNLGTCLESNNTPFPDLDANLPPADRVLHEAAIEAWTKLLLDAFDGHTTRRHAEGDYPGNGGMWVPLLFGTGIEALPVISPRQNDEVIRLGGADLLRLMEKWKEETSPIPQLRFDDMAAALSRTMLEDGGYNDSQVCRAFALQSTTGNCLDVASAEILHLDVSRLALDLGDLVPPLDLRCSPVTQMPGAVACDWEDTSVGADGFQMIVGEPASPAPLVERFPAYRFEVVGEIFTLPPGFFGPLEIEVRALKGTRVGPKTTDTMLIPEPPLPTCGNGVIDVGEVCDGSSNERAACGTGICTELIVCAADCRSVSVDCLCQF